MEIEKELTQKLPEVNDLLANLDIAVGFLVSVGGAPDMLIVKFMVDTLKMKALTLTSAVCVQKAIYSTDLYLLLNLCFL